MATAPVRVLIIGAHPDDPDFCCGGVAIQWAAQGHVVKFLSLTNGDTGHYEIGGIELARRRYHEAQASARVAGISEYQILDNHCGELEPSIANRKTVIRLIREFRPDLVITHRPNDYHPDHRYTSQLVLDASYIITVPNMVSLTDILNTAPLICYVHDRFTRPYPFHPDVVVGTDDVIEGKIDMLDCHVSQVYEWLPYNRNVLDQVPADPKARRRWLPSQYLPRFEEVAASCREGLIQAYGPQKGRAMRTAEAFELSEYGSRPGPQEIRRLFPFFD